MHESFSSYLKIIPFAIKKRRVLEFINLEFQKDTDRFRRHRFQEYVKRAISSEEAIPKLFPDIKIDYSLLDGLEDHLDQFIETKRKEKYPSINNPYPVIYGLNRSVSRLLYHLCYVTKPSIVVETGVANGFSSSYILSAMEKVNHGKLFSIDGIIRPWHTAEKIGLAIPANLKKRQNLILGNASKELEKLLDEINQIDIFIHDSSHTYQNMKKEFRIAWPHIMKGGFLFSDDVSQHDAFLDFADEINVNPIIISKDQDNHVGLIKKENL